MNTCFPVLRQMAREEIGLDADPRHDTTPFLDLGMDSLMVMDFLFSVEERFGVEISYAAAMVRPTLKGLAALVDSLRERDTRVGLPGNEPPWAMRWH